MQLCLRRSRRIVGDIDKIGKEQKKERKVQKLKGDLAKVKTYAVLSMINQLET